MTATNPIRLVFNRLLRSVLILCLTFQTGLSPVLTYAEEPPATVLDLPVPGTMLYTTPEYNPALLKGVTINPDNPLQFNFLIDTGEDDLDGEDLVRESTKLIKYFLASLTVPEDKMWVNLSPFEKNRIIPNEFGRTEMGRDLLAQDYMLKQLTASLIYPEDDLGREFWDRVYKRAMAEFGTTDVPVNTYNKIWIIPEQADVLVQDETVFVVNSRLKVMLEEDYLALEHHTAEKPGDTNVLSEVSSQIVREVLIPEIEHEVNHGRTFAPLRQIYNSMILATWYKKNLRDSFLGEVYVNKNRTDGVNIHDEQINQKIYDQYVTAFKEGVYSYIKEEYDPELDEIIPKKYFSGGVDHSKLPQQVNELVQDDVAQPLTAQGRLVNVSTGLRGQGTSGAEAMAFDQLGRRSDLAVLPFYQSYRFNETTPVIENMRFRQYRRVTVRQEGADGQMENVEVEVEDDRGYVLGLGFPERELISDITPEAVRTLRESLEGLAASGQSAEKLVAIQALVSAIGGYSVKSDVIPYDTRKALGQIGEQLKNIPRDGNRRRQLLNQIGELLRGLPDQAFEDVLIYATTELGDLLKSEGSEIKGWSNVSIRLLVNTETPFEMRLRDDGEAAELNVDLLTILRGAHGPSVRLSWEAMRTGLKIEEILAEKLGQQEVSGFLRSNPLLIKQVLQVLYLTQNKLDSRHGPRSHKYRREDRTPEWLETERRYKNNYYDDLRADRGLDRLTSLLRQLEGLANIIDPDATSIRYEADIPARATAIIEFIQGRAQLQEEAGIQGSYTPQDVTAIAELFGSLSRELGENFQVGTVDVSAWDGLEIVNTDTDRRTTTTSTTVSGETEAEREARERDEEQRRREDTKEEIVVHARELLSERDGTPREFDVADESSAFAEADVEDTEDTGDTEISLGTQSETSQSEREQRSTPKIIYVPLNVSAQQYLDRMQPAVEAMQETTDPAQRTVIFFADVWPQLLMAGAHDVANKEMLRLTQRAAGLLDSSLERIFLDLTRRSFTAPLVGQQLRNYSDNVNNNRLQIDEIARQLRNNPFLKEQMIYVRLQVLDRKQNMADGTERQVSLLSSLAYRIDDIEIDVDGPRDRRGELPEIFYLGERVDRIDEDISALGFTWLGDTVGVVLKDMIDGETYRELLPHLYNRPFVTLGNRPVHRLSQLSRQAVQRDFPLNPTADEVTAIRQNRYQSTGIHERQHTRDELNGVQDRFSGVGQRVAQETTAYLASIAYGDAPFTDLLKVVELHISLRSGFGALFALFDGDIYGKATENILNLFADRLDIDGFNLRDNLLDSNADVLEAALALDQAGLKQMAADILDDVIADQSRGRRYVEETQVAAADVETADVEIETADVESEAIPFFEPMTTYEKVVSVMMIAALVIGPFIYYQRQDDAPTVDDLDLTEPIIIEKVTVVPETPFIRTSVDDPPKLLTPDQYRDLERLLFDQLFDYAPRPEDFIEAVRDTEAFVTRPGDAQGTLSGISKMYFDTFFNFPEIHAANAQQYDLDPLPDLSDWDAIRGFYMLPQGIELVVPGALEVEYEVQPGESITDVARRFYGILPDGSQRPVNEFDGVRDRWFYERIAERNGISAPYTLGRGQKLIIPTNKLEYARNILGIQSPSDFFIETENRTTRDRATLPNNPTGGIDLNANNMDLRTTGTRIQMNVPIELQDMQDLPIEGFVPVIINIVPVQSIPLFLGDVEDDQNLASDEDVPLIDPASNDRLSRL